MRCVYLSLLMAATSLLTLKRSGCAVSVGHDRLSAGATA